MVSRFTDGFDGGSSAGREAPAFTPEEKRLIDAWSDAMRARGLRIEAALRPFETLKEAVLVFTASGNDPAWLVHKTPTGAVAVRSWPDVAQIVATVPDALAIIAAAAERGDG